MLKEMTLEEFVQEVASSSPAPGGGSVAALAGAQAAGLLSMYCSLSQNREKLGDIVDVMRESAEESRFLMSRLLEAVDEDTVALNRVTGALRLPSGTGLEREVRRKAINEAAAQVVEVPLQAGRGMLRILSIIGEVAGKGNPEVISELVVANAQAHAGLVGACYSVSGSLSLLENNQAACELQSEARLILEKGREFYEENRALIERELS